MEVLICKWLVIKSYEEKYWYGKCINVFLINEDLWSVLFLYINFRKFLLLGV